MATDTLENLLSGLSLGPSTELADELEASGFVIFTPQRSLGFYMWKSSGNYKSLTDVTAVDITKRIDSNGKPSKFVLPSSKSLPFRFRALDAEEHINKFPYGQTDVASLHVAAFDRHLKWKDIDFTFGGSTLEMLAQQDNTDPYFVTKVPYTDGMILVSKCKEFSKNIGDPGFQFERLVTGQDVEDCSDLSSVVHLHTMDVGSHRVLFRAEVDSLENGLPVEVKASNPQYWGTHVMFQMMSCGSTKLCQGNKRRGSVVSIQMLRLSEVARMSTLGRKQCERLEKNILDGMQSLKKQMLDAQDGELFKVSFVDGALTLLPSRTRTRILPPDDVVKELVTPPHYRKAD